MSSGATVTGKGSYYGTGISSSYSGDIIVSSGATVMASRGIEAGYSGNIIVSSGATVTGTGGTSYCGGICTSYNNGDIILSSGVVKGRSIGVYVKEGFGQESPITLTLSGNAKILPVDEQTPFTRGAIHFDDDYVSSRNTLNLATDPDNIQGLVWSSIDKTGPESGPSELQNTNTLTLSGEENLSLSLSEFGVNGTDLISEGWDDIQGTKGKKFFAFDTIVKEGTGTWTLSGTLDKDIITGYTDDEGIQHLGFSINEGKIALAANTIAHTDMVVNPNGTLYSQAGGKQLIDSLAIKGTYQVDVNSHNDYSQLHSTKDIVIEEGSKLYVYADKLRGGDDTFLNVLTTDGELKGRFNPKVEDNSILFDFTALYEPQAMHLNAKAVPAPEPEPEPTPTPEPKPEPTLEPKPGLIEHLVKQACDDDCLAPMAASLDKIKASVDNDIAFDLMKLTSEKDVVNAVEQIQPLLGIRTSRVIMEATDTLIKAIPTGRCLADAGDNQVWAKVLGEWNERNGSSGLSGYQATHSGIAIGSERCVTESTKLGLTAGYLKTDADSYDSAANHNLKADTWQVGIYGNTALTPQWDIDFYAGIGQAYLDGKRHLSFLGRTAESEMKANHFRTGITLNRAFQVNPQAKVTPFIGLDYQRVEVEDYIEKGAKDFNFAIDKQSTEAFIAKLGIKGDFQINERLSLQAKAAVGYDMTYRGNYLRAGFVNYPKYRFTLEECDPSRVTGELDVGAKYQISQNVALGAGVQSTFAKGFNSVAGNVNLSIQF
ncbi:hypothetical protein QV09_06295 [Gallibacterium salpingitidis]|uniref:Autotransporter domain-containing protein n=1 Tax=Gallibacterium salpingitidis TaxID=505341 RepID=A0AB36E3M4_9PAST|nr:autotransporter outer membrane beta-barrel domain-containing protein [Gallibacterium salpingitidis]OBX10277.1 hypothetical protein QV09_06295 [Gallibacterium salpingitidis]